MKKLPPFTTKLPTDAGHILTANWGAFGDKERPVHSCKETRREQPDGKSLRKSDGKQKKHSCFMRRVKKLEKREGKSGWRRVSGPRRRQWRRHQRTPEIPLLHITQLQESRMLDYNRYLVSCNLVGNKSIYPASQVWRPDAPWSWVLRTLAYNILVV